MAKILFVTHGKMASGMQSTLEIIAGHCSQLTAIDAYVDAKNIQETINKYFRQLQDNDQLIMLSDIENGSANQLLFKHLERPKTVLFTGVNLPLLLQLFLIGNKELSDSDLKKILEESRTAIKLFQNIEQDEDEDEDFF